VKRSSGARRMNKIVCVDGIPIVHVFGRTLVLLVRHGIRFVVESQDALRRTQQSIDLLHETGFDEIVKDTGMFIVVLNTSPGNFSAHMGYDKTTIGFFDFEFLIRMSVRYFASAIVHEARHSQQLRDTFSGSRLQRESDACNIQIDFLHCVGGNKEIKYIEDLFRSRKYWWKHSKKEQADWRRWIKENELILYGLKELGVVS